MIKKEDHRVGDEWRIKNYDNEYIGTTIELTENLVHIKWLHVKNHPFGRVIAYEYNNGIFKDIGNFYYKVKDGNGKKIKIPAEPASWRLTCPK